MLNQIVLEKKKKIDCDLSLASESSVKSKDIQEGRYTKREISANYQLLWRILTDLNEIEVVMKVKGTGYDTENEAF